MRTLTLYIALMMVALCGQAQITYETVFIDYDSAILYRNLKVIPVRAKGLPPSTEEVISLNKGLQDGSVVITERGSASTENVHWVRIKNKSGKPLYVASGEIIIGGRQDRMIAKDTILDPTGGDQYIPAMCVEEGRWSNKEKKFEYHGFSNPRLRKVMDQSKNQVLIWKEVYAQLSGSKIKSKTLAYGAWRSNKENHLNQSDYLGCFLEKINPSDSTILGIICISGDKILGTDIFAANNLFMDESSAILAGYIEEAIKTGAEPEVKDGEVELAMYPILNDEISQEEYCRKNGKLYKYKGKVFHVTGYF